MPYTIPKSKHSYMPIYNNPTFSIVHPMVFSTICSLNVNDLHRTFESLDQNGDGLLSIDELTWLLERTGVHANHDELVSLVGETGLDFDEFSYFYDSLLNKKKNEFIASDQHGYVGEEEEDGSELYKAFKVFDLDGDGLISPKELRRVLWRLGMWDVNGRLDRDRIIHENDVNSDGFLDFEEFKRMMLFH